MTASNLCAFLNDGFYGIGNDKSQSQWLFPRQKLAFYVTFFIFYHNCISSLAFLNSRVVPL